MSDFLTIDDVYTYVNIKVRDSKHIRIWLSKNGRARGSINKKHISILTVIILY